MAEQSTDLRRPVLLVILDGVGINPSTLNNAVYEASTPRLDDYFSRYPHTVLQASGAAVGLPEGQMGNSEVGHLTLGGGCIVAQDLTRIDAAIETGDYFANPMLIQAAQRALACNRPLHIVGLISDGGVHSHLRHLAATLQMCKQQGVKPVLHMITDGRDTPPRHVHTYLPMLNQMLDEFGGVVASVCGRYYAMDRDQRWERVEPAWSAMVQAKGRRCNSLNDAIARAYSNAESDEFITPSVIADAPIIAHEDEVFFLNFRNDRARQLAAALSQADFSGFDRQGFLPVHLTSMTEYDPRLDLPIAFAPQRPAQTLSGRVSEAGFAQFHCAETEKYAHVTFFFNGGVEAVLAGEQRQLIPSPKVATYDLQPEMHADQVTDAVIAALHSHKYAFIVVNYANGDMVGHTAVKDAVIQAVETLDHEVGRLLDSAIAQDYSIVVTADHGNCEELVDPHTGQPQTQHSLFPVPCMVIDSQPRLLAAGGGLCDVAPTVLDLMGLSKPPSMTGNSLLLHNNAANNPHLYSQPQVQGAENLSAVLSAFAESN